MYAWSMVSVRGLESFEKEGTRGGKEVGESRLRFARPWSWLHARPADKAFEGGLYGK